MCGELVSRCRRHGVVSIIIYLVGELVVGWYPRDIDALYYGNGLPSELVAGEQRANSQKAGSALASSHAIQGLEARRPFPFLCDLCLLARLSTELVQ